MFVVYKNSIKILPVSGWNDKNEITIYFSQCTWTSTKLKPKSAGGKCQKVLPAFRRRQEDTYTSSYPCVSFGFKLPHHTNVCVCECSLALWYLTLIWFLFSAIFLLFFLIFSHFFEWLPSPGTKSCRRPCCGWYRKVGMAKCQRI